MADHVMSRGINFQLHEGQKHNQE